MMELHLICLTSDFRKGMKHLAVALPKTSKGRHGVHVEVSLKPQEILLSGIGASYKLPAQCSSFAKFFVPFNLISTIVQSWKNDSFDLIVSEGKIQLGDGTIISVPGMVIVHPENQGKIELTMNYSVGDLIRLRKQHSIQELERMNLLEKIQEAENQQRADVLKAYTLLEKYGIDYSDFVKFIDGQIIQAKRERSTDANKSLN